MYLRFFSQIRKTKSFARISLTNFYTNLRSKCLWFAFVHLVGRGGREREVVCLYFV